MRLSINGSYEFLKSLLDQNKHSHNLFYLLKRGAMHLNMSPYLNETLKCFGTGHSKV